MNEVNEAEILAARKSLQKEMFRHPIKHRDIMVWYACTVVFIGLVAFAHFTK